MDRKLHEQTVDDLRFFEVIQPLPSQHLHEDIVGVPKTYTQSPSIQHRMI
jgi:hypothetical protein